MKETSMPIQFQQLMREATRLTRIGKLQAATAAIQSLLRSRTSESVPPPVRSQQTSAPELGEAPRPAPQPDVARGPAPPGRFTTGGFALGAMQREFKLYIPGGAGREPLPLIVMLHGCTQNPDDFAAGTGMNEAAEDKRCYVLYPAQSRQANPHGCWNWFKHNHQQRDRGEPALLAGMTRHVMGGHSVDPRRVYVAGLSAGGAMAAILGVAYPELYAAVGVHSGLAAGVATDVPSALAAMRSGSVGCGTAHAVPTIVFHGDADATVHPANGRQVIAACAGSTATVESHLMGDESGRAATRHVHSDPLDGRVLGEHWVVHGAAHAWSGGNEQGSYADSRGPDATAEMLRFFFEHPRQLPQ
jgi:poly(hydroxyalkanoate) depolymerase family esterase